MTEEALRPQGLAGVLRACPEGLRPQASGPGRGASGLSIVEVYR